MRRFRSSREDDMTPREDDMTPNFKTGACIGGAVFVALLVMSIYMVVTPPTNGEAADESTYDRKAFKHWIDEDKDCQDSRVEVLFRDAEANSVKFKTEDECKIEEGRWRCVYTLEEFTDPSKLDIDHIIPLKNAWSSGADKWTDEQRRDFANDLANLLAVSASANRSKGAKGPDEWMPPANSCAYVRSWVQLKDKYELMMTVAEANRTYRTMVACSLVETPRAAAPAPVEED